jgi:hypothetical protein
MKCSHLLKMKPPGLDIGVAGYEVEFTAQDLGIPQPSSIEEAKDAAVVASSEAAIVTYIMMYGEAVITRSEVEAIVNQLKESSAGARARVDARIKAGKDKYDVYK